jgi:hypothetical protein
LEKAKVPTVTIVTDQFMTLARGTQKSQGLTDLCLVEVPHPIGMIPKAEVYAKVDKAFDDIIKASISWKASKADLDNAVKPYPARKVKFKGTYASLNELFAKRKWSINLPIVPPTPEKVAAMLKGTKRSPEEVVWVVPPRQGMLTVELVAALGVMAGAEPEHMPVLLAVIEGFKHPHASWRGTTTTTAYTVPVIVLSGAMIEKFGLNAGTGVSGPLNPLTNALGYFINLVGDVVGGSVAPNFDKSTHGGSGDFVAQVFVENDKANPWNQSYAEEQGFKKEDSVVTVFGAYLGGANVDHDSTTGQSLLNTMAVTMLGNAGGVYSCLADYNKPIAKSDNMKFSFLFLNPEHAKTITQDFPTKQGAKEYLIQTAGLPFKYYAPERCNPPAGTGPDTFLHRYVSTDSIKIVVTGGAGKQSQIWSPFPQCIKPVSVKVDF